MAVFEIEPAVTDFIDPAALLFIGVAARVEHHAIPWLHRSFGGSDLDEIPSHTADHPGKRTALLAISRRHEFLMIYPVEPARVEPARKRHLKLVAIRLA